MQKKDRYRVWVSPQRKIKNPVRYLDPFSKYGGESDLERKRRGGRTYYSPPTATTNDRNAALRNARKWRGGGHGAFVEDRRRRSR